MAALAWRWLGSRTLFLFSALAAARFPADRVLVLGLAHLGAAPVLAGAGAAFEAAVGATLGPGSARRERDAPL